MELGFEQIFFCHNLGENLVGNFFESFKVLNFFGEGFLVPVFIFFESAYDGREAFLLVMQVLSEVGDSIFELGDPFVVEGFVLDT